MAPCAIVSCVVCIISCVVYIMRFKFSQYGVARDIHIYKKCFKCLDHACTTSHYNTNARPLCPQTTLPADHLGSTCTRGDIIGASLSEPHTSDSNGAIFIGASAASPTLVVKTENCLYICIYVCIYMYICIYICIYVSVYIYILPHLCAMQYFHTACNHWHCCSRDKTSRIEKLNNGNQRINRDLKTVRKGRHYYQDRG